MRRLFARHRCSHPQSLKEQMATTQINGATKVCFQKSFGHQEHSSSRHHVHTQYSIYTCNSNKEYGHGSGFSVSHHYQNGKSWLSRSQSSVCAKPPLFLGHPFPFARVLSNQEACATGVHHSLPNVTFRTAVYSPSPSRVT